ncbi:Rossmann-fold NAD(P)-binding domain-containing protein [Rufibacter hautae]|uniref:Lactate dehydrogenase n=1 Tax=Rufibacter hautae TaxID=2595005 RepID=A0A5B6TA18_9BACT|nr:lactate dehydrogenase [Rufibacter hautae]KAA3435943.1 lactate dehydrogenase [Rufibacter hautae]
MKVIAYGIRPSEKVILAQANHKKHDITLISNPLSTETAFYAQGKEAVIVFSASEVSEPVLELLAKTGIKYIATHSNSLGPHVSEKGAAEQHGILWANVTGPSNFRQEPTLEDLQQMATQTIGHLDNWQLLD